MYELIYNYLIREPKARERHLHQRAMVNILLEKYPELKEIPKDKLVDFCHDFESYCRIWRKVVEENENLRGLDYNTKDKVEQEYMLRVGFEPNYQNNVRMLETL